ncbi:MAG TPA: diguanylate cyclase [Pseudolabrys sp.]|nr:diguanylate cyclase [Pseudolabrys sp.]
MPALMPVAVTRWGAQLADPASERDYRLDRFEADRRRVVMLMVLALAAGALNCLLELSRFAGGNSSTVATIAAFAAIVVPLCGFAAMALVRTPIMLEVLVIAAAVVGMVTRLGQLTLHPEFTDLWTTLMVGIVFVIYLYLPIRLGIAVALAVGLSVVGLSWWWLAQGGALPAAMFARGVICLMMSNAVGCVAANSLHRSQRMQFAQRLVLQHLLSTDAMTGIANRRRFDAALTREWRRCRRVGAPLSLLMIDVDHFKAYNDHCGHPQGDACLRQVAQVLVEAVGRPGDLAARYGGEEFVCLLPEIGAAGALAVANRAMAALRQANIMHPQSPVDHQRLTVSIGVATANSLAGEPEGLVEFADQLLYAAKDSGRNQVKTGQLAPTSDARAA